MSRYLNELGYVEGKGEESHWDDVNQKPPSVHFYSTELQLTLSELQLRAIKLIIDSLSLQPDEIYVLLPYQSLPDTSHGMGECYIYSSAHMIIR